nr:hypothetical protein [Tanacetum cinerariifolium]
IVRNKIGISVDPRIENQYGIGNVLTTWAKGKEKRDAAHLQQHMQIAQKGEARIQITQEEFDFMAVAGACEETKKVTVNFTSEDTWQQASISSTQSDNAPVYDSDGSVEDYETLEADYMYPSIYCSLMCLGMAYVYFSAKPELQIKGDCMLQCALPLKEEKSSCF